MKTIKKTFTILPILALLMSFTISEDWFQLSTSKYSIMFPKAPNSRIDTVSTETGQVLMESHMFDASSDDKSENLIYGVFTSEYPKEHIAEHKKHDNFETLFNNSISGMVNNVNGKLISETNITLEKNPGKEIKIDYMNGLAIIKARIYIVNTNVYILQTITLTEKDNNKSIDKFMNSFKLKK